MPLFDLTPEPITDVAAADDLHLQCIAWGIPRPQVTWYKDGISLENDSHVHLKDNGKLTIWVRNVLETLSLIGSLVRGNTGAGGHAILP